MRSGVHPVIADMIVGHGDQKNDVQSLYLTVSDQDLLDAVDKMRFDGEGGDENGGVFGNSGMA